MQIIHREIRNGEARQVGNYQITPQTQVIQVQIPGRPIGIIWNRPKAVIIKTSDGTEKILPVRDVTRLVIWSLLAGGLLGALLVKVMRQ